MRSSCLSQGTKLAVSSNFSVNSNNTASDPRTTKISSVSHSRTSFLVSRVHVILKPDSLIHLTIWQSIHENNKKARKDEIGAMPFLKYQLGWSC